MPNPKVAPPNDVVEGFWPIYSAKVDTIKHTIDPFQMEEIERMVEHFETLLDKFVNWGKNKEDSPGRQLLIKNFTDDLISRTHRASILKDAGFRKP